MNRLQVLFSGEIADGANEATVRQNLMRRLGLDERKVPQLFSGRTVVIRGDLSREAADALQAELAALGAIARIKDPTPDEKAKFKIDARADKTLKDITAAHAECPRCGHVQLEAEFCARCGVDISTARKNQRKQDALIEKKIRGLKEGKVAGPAAASVPSPAAPNTPLEDPSERIEPIKRRVVGQRAVPTTRSATPRPARPVHRSPPVSNPFGGGFWRGVFRFGRKD
jgi:ribosomal protein L37E